MTAHRSGRHFLQLPGPTNVPERVLRAMDRAVIDHRGPEFSALVQMGLRFHEIGTTDGVNAALAFLSGRTGDARAKAPARFAAAVT